MMMLIVLTSLPAADCSTFLLLRREKLDHQWFEAGSVVQPVPMSTMNVGVVGLGVVDAHLSYIILIHIASSQKRIYDQSHLTCLNTK